METATTETRAIEIVETLYWKLSLLNQATRGIAHRGKSGDIESVTDECQPVEDLVRTIRADLRTVHQSLFRPV